MEDTMKIGVVSPLALTRKTLCAWLTEVKDLCVVLDVASLFNGLELIQECRPDILVIDAVNPASDLEMVSQVAKLFPGTKVLLLSDEAGEEFELRAIKAGAHGSVSKRSEPQVLERALKIVGEDEIWVSHHVATRIISEFRQYQDQRLEGSSEELTHREEEILVLLAEGYHNKEIAGRLFISENTVKTHLNAIYRKLQVNTRLEAALQYFGGTRSKLPGSPLQNKRQRKASEARSQAK
jgi:DNA-binding NarL/FixJ family response regulator